MTGDKRLIETVFRPKTTINYTLEELTFVTTPAEALHQLIWEATNVVARNHQDEPHPVAKTLVSGFTTQIARGLLQDLGLPTSLGKGAGPSILRNEKTKRSEALAIHQQQWSERVIQTLGGISAARTKLPTNGNSSSLAKGFLATTKHARPETRFDHGRRYLERLVQQKLVFNSEIPQLLKQRVIEAAAERRRLAEIRMLDLPELAPGIDALKFPNRAALEKELVDFPEEATMLTSAMEALLGDTADRCRHAAAGARSALESIGRKVTGAQDWKKELDRLTSREISRSASALYQLLSSLTHPGRPASLASTQLAMRQATNMIVWLAHQRKALRAT